MIIKNKGSDIVDKLLVVLTLFQLVENHSFYLALYILGNSCQMLILQQFIGKSINVDIVEVSLLLNLIETGFLDFFLPILFL